MVNLQSSDVLHHSLLGGGLPVVGIIVQAPFVLAAVVMLFRPRLIHIGGLAR